MNKFLSIFNSNKPQQKNTQTDLVEMSESILLETRSNLANKQYISLPIDQMATLGAGVASLLPAFRTVTQTTSMNVDGLYRLANATVGDTLKVAKNGNFWGAFKTADGTSKFAQLQAAGTAPVSTTTVMPIDPATIMMAAALYSIEQKLDNLAEMQKQILTFLEVEKESEIEADMEMLSSMLTKYKHGWDNEHFITSNHKLVLDIQRTARKNMISYQKNVTEALIAKKLFVSQSKVNSTLDDLLKKFKYYRLSLYIFSMASFVEIMLSGDFKEENILCVKEEIEKMSASYRDLFGQCSVYLEKMSDSSIETNLLKGIGTASKAVGKFIESIPVIKEGPVDEFLQDSGSQMKENAVLIERKIVEAFAEISNPGVGVFTEKMGDMIRIYGHTEEIFFDDKQVYLVAG